ncbi:nucleoside diphosphate kinase regulator [Xanthomonas hortorum pv. gardneri]|nr:nucleoside diphosphate kinase regulator [Xanthomonas hortorum]MCC8499117.1 nucleoside diphosphate kinase regulator [Xanthomonas hortorum pv. gardneri]MCC8509801.1 nucleoside diphosphate kinase regulator [Xanthomonas hortorum pv. gardneri]MCC8513138.1 nucleoside diphosphate kinase regulator [Xanthomonas hortorum pv. gardneri]MCC8522850.1 nucleoside diphosphate kinase regulator [Xanthomonas hortorum pv. gardneri]MCC8523096.1 nucleoside diphosphate kinase regulator [Xanthomonas hortorum pv. ga
MTLTVLASCRRQEIPMPSQHHSGLPPSILVSSHDLARLEALLDSPAFNKHPAATALSDELGRARVVPPDQIPGDVVTMYSRIDCEDELHGERHTLTLVYPHEADVQHGRISVLAPVGSALLGLSVGQSIDWRTPDGRDLRLRVTAVHDQHALADDLQR